jgi:hypothetical protein
MKFPVQSHSNIIQSRSHLFSSGSLVLLLGNSVLQMENICWGPIQLYELVMGANDEHLSVGLLILLSLEVEFQE